MQIHQTEENEIGTSEPGTGTCIHSGKRIVKLYGNGSLGKVEGGSTARISKKRHLSPRDKIIGDLASLGMSGADISRTLHGDKNTKGKEVAVRMIKNDEKVQMYVQREQDEIVASAKQRLLEAVPRAAENICNAIDEGDITCSLKVLTSHGALESAAKKGDTTINLNFGDWLISQRREVTVDGEGLLDSRLKPRRITTNDVDDLDLEVEGERL